MSGAVGDFTQVTSRPVIGECGLFTKISLSSKLILCLLCMTYNCIQCHIQQYTRIYILYTVPYTAIHESIYCIQSHIQQYTNLYTVYSAIYSNTRIYILYTVPYTAIHESIYCIQCHIQQYTNLYTVYSAIYSNTRIYILYTVPYTAIHESIYKILPKIILLSISCCHGGWGFFH